MTAMSSHAPGIMADDDTVEYPGDDADDPDELDGVEVLDEEIAQSIRLFLPLISKQ